MKPDPPIDEIRAVRHGISEEFGHDTQAMLNHYRELEKLYSERLLRPRSSDLPDAGKPTESDKPR